MDEHPVDVLRLYLAIGVIENMPGLSKERRADYVQSVEQLATATAAGAKQITLQGLVEVSHDHWTSVDTAIPLNEAALAARQVGKLIATHKFEALENHSIQDIETWDDSDEDTAAAIAAKILDQQSIVAAGDDAQLLAGATMAMLKRPDLYDTATKLLVDALDDSYRRDPIWGRGTFDHMFAPARLQFTKAHASRRTGSGISKPAAKRGKLKPRR